MFALVFSDGKQFSVTAGVVARLLNQDKTVTIKRRRDDGRAVITLTDERYDISYTIVTPGFGWQDMIYQAGGPELT